MITILFGVGITFLLGFVSERIIREDAEMGRKRAEASFEEALANAAHFEKNETVDALYRRNGKFREAHA